MSKKKIIFYNNTTRLNEEYQTVAMKFSFISREGEEFVQCHDWIACRDFLHDAIRGMLTRQPSSIYGFSYSHDKNPPLDLKHTRLLVSQKGLKCGDEFEEKLFNALKLVNHYEFLVGIELTKITKIISDLNKNYKYIWEVKGPKFWMNTPYLISMYTLLLRLGYKNIKFDNKKELKEEFKRITKNPDDNNTRYLKKIYSKLEPIILKHKSIIDEKRDGFSSLYFEETPIGSFHHKSGIVSTCTGASWSTKLNERILSLEEK